MRRFLYALSLTLAGMTGPFGAQAQSVVVVELYTSQGCSSCPAADAILSDVAQRDDVIALGLHVDYWDYLGWADDLANPAFTERQARFNTIMKSRYRLVTPQLIFSGRDYVAGAKRAKALDYIDMLAAEPERAKMTVTRAQKTLDIVVSPVDGKSAAAEVYVVRFQPKVVRDIKRGENAGRQITYTNTVTSWETVADWDGKSQLRLSHPVAGDDKVAVIVQTENLGPVQVARQVN